MDENMPNASQEIADNVLLLAIARISMALALPVIGTLAFFGSQWLDSRFEAQNATMENQSRITTARIETVERTAQSAIDQSDKVNNRLSIVETKQSENAASNEKFQIATLNRLDRVQDSLVGLSNAVSALTATLQTIIENNRNRAPPK